MDRCVNCGEGVLVKYGHRKYKDGKKEQIYLCKCCNKVVTAKQRHKKLNAEQKSRIDDMVNEGVGLRKIQRLIKVKNVNTVSNYLKKSQKLKKAYEKYINNIQSLLGKKELIIDELYTYIGSKADRHYVWVGIIKHGLDKYSCFHLSRGKKVSDLDEFVLQLPEVETVYSDKNPVYKEYYGKKNVAQKGCMTNLAESVNSQLRGYCSRLIRKTKSYAKSFDSLLHNLYAVFLSKIIK